MSTVTFARFIGYLVLLIHLSVEKIITFFWYWCKWLNTFLEGANEYWKFKRHWQSLISSIEKNWKWLMLYIFSICHALQPLSILIQCLSLLKGGLKIGRPIFNWKSFKVFKLNFEFDPPPAFCFIFLWPESE